MSIIRPGNYTPPPKGTSSTPPEAARSTAGAPVPPPAAGATGAASQGVEHGEKVEIKAESIRGGGYVHGNQFNFFTGREGEEGTAAAPPWEDELLAVSRLPEPAQAIDQAEVERRTTGLQASRLLLLRHSLGCQQDAEASMQGVLLALRRREPDRQAFTTGFDTIIPLRKLAHHAWREDRRGSVLYLYRSDDPASLDFFNRIERVDMLSAQLAAMDCYLLITVSTSGTTVLGCEHELDRHIGLWSFTSTQAPETENFDTLASNRFELTLASCAALFPGLSADEFTALVKLLWTPASAPPPAPPSTPSNTSAAPPPVSPPGRPERWSQGERGAVLAELGLRLQRPPQANDGNGEGTYAGIFFDDTTRRGEVPAWLYERHAFLLAELFPTLTAYYLTPQASRRFGVGYRRLVQQLDTTGVYPVNAAWLTRQVQAALDMPAPHTAIQRVAELVAVLPDVTNGDRLIADLASGLGDLIVAEEVGLQAQLNDTGLPGDVAAQRRAQRPSDFWYELHGMPAARRPIEHAIQRQELLVDLLLAVSFHAPQAVVRTAGDALNRCNAAHRQWLRAAGWPWAGEASMDLARMVFHARLPLLLRQDPETWLAMATALGHVYPPAPVSRTPFASPHVTEATRQAQATGRWLAWECLYALGALLGNLPDDPWPDANYAALLGDDAGAGLGKALVAPLLLAADDQPDTEPSVDAESTLWIYHWLTLAAMVHKPGDPAHADQVASALVTPMCAAIPSPRRMRLVELAVSLLAEDGTKRFQAANRDERDQISRRIQALQLVTRRLRSRMVPALSR